MDDVGLTSPDLLPEYQQNSTHDDIMTWKFMLYALLAFCEGNGSPVDFAPIGPVMRSFDISFVVRLNKV